MVQSGSGTRSGTFLLYENGGKLIKFLAIKQEN